MDFMFFVNALLRKKWVIIICTIAGIGAGVLYTFTQPPMYLSAATYSTGFTMKQQVNLTTDEGLNIFEIDQRFKNVIETFKSPVVVCMLSYDLMLHDLDAQRPFTTLTDKEKAKNEYKDVNLDKARQILLQKKAKKEILRAYDPEEKKVYELIQLYRYDNDAILDQLTVDRVSGTDYLNILYKSRNPEMSAFVVNTIGKEFISFFTSIMSSRTEESTGKLDTLAAKKKREIDSATAKLSDLRMRATAGDGGGKTGGTGNDAGSDLSADLQSQLSTERIKLSGMNSDLATVNQLLAKIPDASPSGPAAVNNSELLDLQRKNRDLSVELQRKGGSDATIEQQIADNQAKIDKLRASMPVSSGGGDRAERQKRKEDLEAQKIKLTNDIEAEKATIASLSGAVGSYQRQAASGKGLEVIAAAMQSNIDRLNKEYEQMTTQLTNALNVTVAPEINFKQTLVGQPAIKPERSKRKTIVGIGGIAALMVSALWIIIMDFLDQSVRAPSIFQKTIHIPLLAVANRIDLKEKTVEDYFNISEETRVGEHMGYIENLRKARFEIESSGKKIILFTSTKGGEGKTSIIEGIANSFSLARKKVLLIDTNFANNSLTEKFQAKELLAQFSLNGESNGAEKLASINTNTKIPYVDIIGCRETAFSPDEVLQKNNLLQNLKRVTEQYDYVLMEGASLNEHADTKELIKYADGIVAVFSAKSVIRQSDKESIKFLKAQHDKLIGAILNNVDKDNIDM